MNEQIRQYLDDLYSASDAEQTYLWLMERIQQTASTLPQRPVSARFSERDVMLITYGDSLRRAGESPLNTLHQFARDHVSGIISAIHILPFFPYSSDDGFSVIDFYQIDPALGNWDDVTALSDDFDLMFDAVFNHMSAQSDWFKSWLAQQPEYAGLFRTEQAGTDLSTVTRPRATPLLTPFKRPNGETVHVWTTFSADQVDLDFRSPDTLIRMIDVLLFYVEHGARYIRLDAIAYLWKEAGTSCIHLEQTHIVIRLMRSVLDMVAPDVIIITETNVPHAENVSYFGDGYNEAQMVYNFTLPPLLFYTMQSGNCRKLRNWANTLTTPSDRTTFFNFTASHDGIGVRPVEGILDEDELAILIKHVEACGGRVSYKQNSDGSQSPYELNITYVDAITDPTESQSLQARRFLLSQAVALSMAGVPAVYIHSLLGTRNDIKGMQESGHNRRINRAKLDVDRVSRELAEAGTFRSQVFAPFRELIRLRIDHAAFHPNGVQTAIDLGTDAVFALLRTAPDESERILCLFNVTGTPQTVNAANYFKGSAQDTITSQTVTGQIALQPYQAMWLIL